MTCDDDDPVADSILIPCYMISKGDGMNIRKVLDRQPVDVSLVCTHAGCYSTWLTHSCRLQKLLMFTPGATARVDSLGYLNRGVSSRT